MNEKYNVMIVDDEYLAQKLLHDYVSKMESLQLVATCSNAFEAMDALKNNEVDIIILDNIVIIQHQKKILKRKLVE